MYLRIYQQLTVKTYVDRFGIGFGRNVITWTEDRARAPLYSLSDYKSLVDATGLPLEAEAVDSNGRAYHITILKL